MWFRNERGSSLILGIATLGAAVGLAYVSSSGLLTAKKSYSELKHSRELQTISKSVLDYGRYILRERKCFNSKTHKHLSKCKFNGDGNLERLILSSTSARDLGQELKLRVNEIMTNRMKIEIPADAIVSGSPLYGPIKNSSLKIGKIVFDYHSSKPKELGNNNNMIRLYASFYDGKDNLMYKRFVKYLLMPRHVNTYALTLNGDLGLGQGNFEDTKTNNVLNEKIKFLSPIYVGGDVRLSKTGINEGLALNTVEHGGVVKNFDGSLYIGADGQGQKWSADKRLGKSLLGRGFKKVPSEPALEKIFSLKYNSKSIPNIGEAMNECIEYTNRATTTEPTKYSLAYISVLKNEALTTSRTVTVGLSKINEFKSITRNSDSGKKGSFVKIKLFGKERYLGINDTLEVPLAGLINDKDKFESFLTSSVQGKIIDRVNVKKSKEIKKDLEDNVGGGLKDILSKTLKGKACGKKNEKGSDEEQRTCDDMYKKEIYKLAINYPELSAGKISLDKTMEANYSDIMSDLLKLRLEKEMGNEDAIFEDLFKEIIPHFVTDKIVLKTVELKNHIGERNNHALKIVISNKTPSPYNTWKYEYKKIKLFNPSVPDSYSADILLSPYNFQTSTNGSISSYFGPNRNNLKNIVGTFNTNKSSISFNQNYGPLKCMASNLFLTFGVCPPLSKMDVDSIEGRLEDFRKKCLGDSGVERNLVAGIDASFTENSFHSWNFNPITKEQAIPGVDTTIDFNALAKMKVDDYPLNTLVVSNANDKIFHTYSVVDHCRIDASASYFFGFVTCRTLTISTRKAGQEKLEIFGSVIVDRLSVAKNAQITWGNIYSNEADQLLKDVEILKSSDGVCAQSANLPSWHPKPGASELTRIKNCQSIELSNTSDPFKWTSFDPECGILKKGDVETKCKALGRGRSFREYIISSGAVMIDEKGAK